MSKQSLGGEVVKGSDPEVIQMVLGSNPTAEVYFFYHYSYPF
jgi:hypothetical protein